VENEAEIDTKEKPKIETKKKSKMAEKEAETRNLDKEKTVPTKKQTTSEADEVDSWTVVRDKKKDSCKRYVTYLLRSSHTYRLTNTDNAD